MKKIIIPKLLIIFTLYLVYILLIKNIPHYNNLKVCLCSPVKKENLYLREFVQHYKSYKVDKIFLYDNNDIDGEFLESVIKDYTLSGYVEVINFRGKLRALYEIMNDCYNKNYMNYDWLIFYEIDEYIHLKNYTNIKKFLNEKKFNGCQTIQLNWLFHTDNEHIYYENKPLKVRFKKSAKFVKTTAIKSILRGKIPNITINCVHKLNQNLKTCNGFGKETHIVTAGTSDLDYEYYFIDHYFCKSTEEFINKLNKGDVLYSLDNIKERLSVYFAVNKYTKDKIDYIIKHIHSNISFDQSLIK